MKTTMSKMIMAGAAALCIIYGAQPVNSARAAPSPAPSPAPAAVGRVISLVAVVESVDQVSREILLRMPDGTLMTVYATPQVRNLAQLRAGDKVHATYRQAMAVRLGKPGGPLPPPSVETQQVRAARGQLPGAGAYALVKDHVLIDSVNDATGDVAFTRADGTTGSVTVHNPAMLNFARQLKPGDRVDIDYVEAVTITVS